MLIYGSLPELVWNALKAFAQTCSEHAETPTLSDCEEQVRRIVMGLTGNRETLAPPVVGFYASEALEMIARRRG